jgi:hypothetical protein
MKLTAVEHEAVQFRWLRYEGGYHWRRTTEAKYLSSGPKPTLTRFDREDWILTTGRPTGSFGLTRVDPEADLFVTFAHVKPSREGIKEFADRFGMLGLPQLNVSIQNDDGSSSRFLCVGELLSLWCDHIGEMKRAVELWERIGEAKSGNEPALRELIEWTAGDCVRYRNPNGGGAVIADSNIYPDILQRFPTGSVIRPAEFYLQRLIDAARAAVSAKLLWRPPTKRSGEQLGLFFVPDSLLSCMWLQLAQAVVGEHTFHRCKAPDCQKLILISRHPRVGASKNKLTCSNTCRIRLYQERMRLAARLHAEGKSIKEIAVALGDNPSEGEVKKKIEKWIKGAAK